MSRRFWVYFIVCISAFGASLCSADGDLPEGPIHDRHELMEVVGAHGRIIGAAMKSGDYESIATAARGMEVAAAKLLDLFPEGSRDARSRALGKIWSEWTLFERMNDEFAQAAAEVAYAADDREELAIPVQRLFQACKTCHEAFRTPEP